MRRIAREYAYKLIFGYLFTKELDVDSREIMLQDDNLSKEDKVYLTELTSGVVKNYDELIDIIVRNSKSCKLDRIFRPDLAALLVAIYEMKYMDDIPMSVSISEIVDIVKDYSTEKSYIYVNGVLAGVYKELNKEV